MTMKLKRLLKIPYSLFTICMFLLVCYGTYGFFTAPAKAKEAQEEIEAMLRAQQEEAERLQREAEEKRRIEEERKREEERQRQEQLLIDTENSYAQEDGYNPATLYRQYTDASEMHIVGIGDSVMLSGLTRLYEKFPNGYFDAVFGRTLYEGRYRLYDLEAQGNLGDVIVFSLGTNSYITEDDCEDLIAHSAGRPTFWLSTFGVANDSTQVMERVVARHDDAYMIYWGDVANENRNQYVLQDGLHLNDTGAIAYADYICQEITAAVLNGPTVDVTKENVTNE